MVKRLLYERQYPLITSLDFHLLCGQAAEAVAFHCEAHHNNEVVVEEWHPPTFEGPGCEKRRDLRFSVPLSAPTWFRKIAGTSMLRLVDEHRVQLSAEGAMHFSSAPRELVPVGRQLPLYVQTLVTEPALMEDGTRGIRV
ncbi:hypothetical protein WJX81_001556 [Elliptochloris bilobata]|uniref:Uncharacterized protein n=1 Tax=Elliptochloris bilobata TaxID=381761 RepID=A0AAW1RR06_9CHLO